MPLDFGVTCNNYVEVVIWAVIVTHWLCAQELFHSFIWSRKQKSVKGKIIVVIGAAHGLGRRIACEFAKLGAHVVCWDHDAERNQNTVWDIRQSNGKATGVTCDVTDRVEVFQSVAHIRDTIGEIDILVNCVGVYPVQPTLTWTPQELYALFDTNVMSQFWLLQAFVPHMITRGSGHLAVISSLAALAPVPNELTYSVTKSAVTGLMDGYLAELRQQGHENIKVTCVHPYYTAVREDIPVKYDIRFDRLSPDFVAGEIVRGIREEQEIISVPRFLLFWIHFMKLLPYSARRRWRDIFYTRVYPTDAIKYYTPDGKKINIVDLYKLPPLSQSTESKLTENLANLKIIPYNNNNNENINSTNKSKKAGDLATIVMPGSNNMSDLDSRTKMTVTESNPSENISKIIVVTETGKSDAVLDSSVKTESNSMNAGPTEDGKELKSYDNAAFTIERF